MIHAGITHARPWRNNASVHQVPYPLADPRQIIRHLLKARGFRSPRALALAAGIPQPNLSRYLAGTTDTMEVASFMALAMTLGVTISELLGEVPLSSGGRIREMATLMHQLPEGDQQALVAAGKAIVEARRLN